MTETPETPPKTSIDRKPDLAPTPEQAAKAARAGRLAAALRDNLKRRKAARPVVKRPGN